jgi:hypothetical protein
VDRRASRKGKIVTDALVQAEGLNGVNGVTVDGTRSRSLEPKGLSGVTENVQPGT